MTAALQTTDIAAILGRAREHQLNMTALQLLCEIDRRGAETLSGLAVQLDLSATAITGCADRLEKLGYAKRRSHSQDRRIWWLDITLQGQRALQSICG